MISDTERREVAHNMRNVVKSKTECELLSLNGSSAAIRWLISYVVFGDKKYHSGVDLMNRLADLIEPSRGSGGRIILCAHCENVSWCGCEPGDEEGGCDFETSVTEGKPPYNLYSLYEAVLRRHPRDKYAIDDDEVEELVDALLDICNAPGLERIQRKQPSETKVRCVAEVKVDGERLEKLIHDAAVELTGIDRDALLALADECDEIRGDGLSIGTHEVYRIARRIREALGVTYG